MPPPALDGPSHSHSKAYSILTFGGGMFGPLGTIGQPLISLL